MVAIADSASMPCARVMRGRAPGRKTKRRFWRDRSTPRGGERLSEADQGLAGRSKRQIGAAGVGIRNPDIVLARSVGLRRTTPRGPPAGRCANYRPRPDSRLSTPRALSTNTSTPALRSASHWRGVTATRRSPGNVSRGHPRIAATGPPLLNVSESERRMASTSYKTVAAIVVYSG